MQTVNFQCGHCGNLMAVSVEYLGQQVRCPTCQQVVLAPAESVARPASPAPEPTFPALEASEDIFHQPTEPEDALFGSEEGPKVELPKEPAPLPPPPETMPAPVEPEPVAPIPSAESTLPFPPAPAQPTAPSESGVATLTWPPTDVASESPPTPDSLTEPATDITTRRDRAGKRVNWFIPLVFIPLVLYAIAATAVAGYLYVLLRSAPPSIFDRMPDVEGDTPGVRKEKPRARLLFTRDLALRSLPEHLHVPLGQTIQIGDLQVTPKKVERRTIGLLAETAPDRPEPSPHEALVLTLHLKNTATDYAFTPLDNYFDRSWKPGSDESVPLTVLQAGKEAFFGGPAKWFPLRRDVGKRQVREWLQGRKNIDRVGLRPGEETETIVATDGWDPVVATYLFGTEGGSTPYRGKLLWRVQVRRGLVPWRGKEVPATAVIGVEFDDTAYARKGS